MLAALTPAGLEISLRAAADLQAERDRLTGQGVQRLERARYLCQWAERQYQACEPENRLVARELERRWAEAFVEARQLEAEFDRFRRSQPAAMTAAERVEVFALATDLLAVWSAVTTTPADGQRVIRCLVERVTVTVDKGTERVRIVIRWLGGCETGHDVRRPVGRYDQLSDLPALLAWIDALRADRLSLAAVAERLNAEGYSPPSARSR